MFALMTAHIDRLARIDLETAVERVQVGGHSALTHRVRFFVARFLRVDGHFQPDRARSTGTAVDQ
ncbi:MAG: hypothetical protein C0443_01415 [Comamonadaceae bacterium]|nr:hypothetical protein [Comamonadaceae bacterium]